MPKRPSEPSTATSFSNETILAIVREIVASPLSQKDRERTFSRKYADFAESCAPIFRMALQPEFDVERLEYLLAMRAKVQSSELSQEEATQAVGRSLYETYVKDTMEGLPLPAEAKAKIAAMDAAASPKP
jgi:hypothetical protein